MNWKILSSKYILKNPYFTARHDCCERSNKKIVDPYYVVEIPVSVCALAITEKNVVIIIKQFRHPINETLLELPGGFVDNNENVEDAIARELLEETGYKFKKIYNVGKVAANPGILNNYTFLFLAIGGEKIAAQQLDANEEIEIILKSIDDVKQMMQQNKFVQALHLSCVYYAFNKLDSLNKLD